MRVMMMRVLGLVALALGSSACLLAEYTVGGAGTSGGGCPEGQVVCGDGCALAGACDDCPEGQEKCEGECVAAGTCEQDVGCPTGQAPCDEGCAPADTCACDLRCDTELEACEDSVCVCRAGLTRCDGACVDTRADAANCDGCGKACGVGTVCADGACVASCGADQQVCGGACVDVKSDSLHCGDCGKLCPADELCLSGNCHPFVTIDGCDSCPCAEACESEDSDGDSAYCCDAPFLGAPVCVQVDCS
jgi:hypothetical protein